MVTFANLGWRPTRVSCAVAALLAALLVAACASPSNGVGGTGEVDSAFSDLAVGNVAGSASIGDASTGVGLIEPPSRRNWSSHIAGLFAIEQIAQAASFSCATTATWGTPSGSNIQYNPATNCTVTYANGTSGSYDVAGTWTFAFTGGTPKPGGAVSNNPTGTVVTRAATSGSVTQSYTGSLGDTYSVTQNTATCTPYTSSVACGGAQVTCTVAPGCPYSPGNLGGTRSIVLLGTQITGTKNGKALYDHTIATTSGNPVVVTGLGNNRVISSGQVVVYHNLARITTTTTINGPLHHELGCAYPIDGSVTTTISGGPNNGKTETVTFTSICGIATVTNPNGTKSTVALHLVL
jgi:hypothetical protein